MILPTFRVVELWNGKDVVGHLKTESPLYGQEFVVSFAPLVLKQIYGRKYEKIRCPIVTRVVSDNGVEIVLRRCLDVRKKSKRQIEKLKGPR